jgi:dTDP-4-dehydrorhamnose reductase
VASFERCWGDIHLNERLCIAVTGLTGQVVSALIARVPKDVEIIALGRPQLDLGSRDAVLSSLKAVHCNAIINAAAYTAVDKAESEPDLAMRVNGEGAGFVAEAAAALKLPLLHLSTDYVFDGLLDRPYREVDSTNPTGAYGRSKLEGEKRIAKIHPNHVILRTAWVYSPYGSNFVKTMLRLGETRDEVGVVSDQVGNPTSALDIADALLMISRRVTNDQSSELRGVFHMSGQGEASWADFAAAIFESAHRHGQKETIVKPITTADYPTPAKRPANSRLDTDKLQKTHGVSLPQWRGSVEFWVQKLLKNS